MSMMGPLITQSLAQFQASERTVAKPGAPKSASDTRARRRPEDAYESIAAEVDAAQALRRLSSNDQEDAREDHQEHQPTLPQPQRHGEHPGIDVNA